jgi:hypothetical protein
MDSRLGGHPLHPEQEFARHGRGKTSLHPEGEKIMLASFFRIGASNGNQ